MGSSNKPVEAVTMVDFLQEQARLEAEAKEILPFDITRCSKPLGQIRQSVYSCLTCNPIQPTTHQRAGVCSSCSVSCHTDHQLVELFVRRNFACDCGTSRCNPNNCILDHFSNPLHADEHDASVSSIKSPGFINKYDKNFDGQFCFCEKGQKYDPETETEDMFQCLACEDWRHANCLGPHPDPDEWDDLICANCVQNDPVISSIMFKYAGGDNTGVLVCTSTEPDQVICHGMISSTANPELLDQPATLESSATEEQDNASKVHTCDKNQSPTQSTSSILPIQNLTNDQLNKNALLQASSKHIHQDKQIDHSPDTLLGADQEVEGEILQGSNEDCIKSPDDCDQRQRYDLVSLNNKRSPSPSLRNDAIDGKKNNKEPKLEEKIDMASQNDSSLDFRHDQQNSCCKAPFKNLSESILNKLDPKFSNVYLTSGWRSRWCNCSDCHAILSKLDWLIQEEEDVWEPGVDTEPLKSIHELGLEALRKLPREKLVDGLLAYNKFKEEFLNFLKPFHSSNTLITELDIQTFFQKIKSQISNN